MGCFFKKRNFIHINVNSLLPKIDSETKLDETILPSELEVGGYDLVTLDQSIRGGGVACYIESLIAYSYKDSFAATSKVFVLTYIFLNLSHSYWISYIHQPIK